MKIKFLKTIFLLALSASTLTSCVGDDDYVIPTVYTYAFNEGFETSTTGSGSVEVPITLDGWVNYNDQHQVQHQLAYGMLEHLAIIFTRNFLRFILQQVQMMSLG